jgi:hypothetical protein
MSTTEIGTMITVERIASPRIGNMPCDGCGKEGFRLMFHVKSGPHGFHFWLCDACRQAAIDALTTAKESA